ncbi:MAG: hypothetical protein ACXIVL_05620 [Oceanicaulis sp.]
MTILHARWIDEDQSMIRAECDDGRVLFIPPDPANADYRTLVEGGEGSAPVAIAAVQDGAPDFDPG